MTIKQKPSKLDPLCGSTKLKLEVHQSGQIALEKIRKMSMSHSPLKDPGIPEMPRIFEVTKAQRSKDGINNLNLLPPACRHQLITRNANVLDLADPTAEVLPT